MRCALATVLSLLVGCSDVRTSAATREAILGGADAGTSSHTFLLELRFDNGSSICTAVLVSPKTLLTAAHCVDPGFHGATTVTVRATNEPDTSMLMNSDMIDVTMMSRHPSWNPADQESGFDVAMLLLQRAPMGVTPVALQRVTPVVGQNVEVLGYGRSSAGDGASSGTRRRVTVPISTVATNTFTFGSSGNAGICAGDSGGPSFFGASVAGVHSRTMSASCGTGVDIRVDRFVSFIDAFIAANDPPPCAMNGVCSAGCGMTDPDCRCIGDGTCDLTCSGTDPDCCVADGQCVAGCSADPDCRCRADGACDMTCGGTDVDCCVADGQCLAGCAADPDCRCRADGTCDMSCGTSDPDCRCRADSTCGAGCMGTDPDCDCRADARCEAGCGSTDPDCDCDADTTCVQACGVSDPDCLDDGQVCEDAAVCVGAQCLNDARGFKFCSRTCTESSECFADMTCQAGVCRAAPDVSEDPVVRGGCSGVPVLGVWLVALLLRRRAH